MEFDIWMGNCIPQETMEVITCWNIETPIVTGGFRDCCCDSQRDDLSAWNRAFEFLLRFETELKILGQPFQQEPVFSATTTEFCNATPQHWTFHSAL